MELVKKTKEHSIWKKRSGRHAVTNAAMEFVKGAEKTKILLAEGLAKPDQVKKPKAEAKPDAAT